jgi:hypothetical protein
MHGFLALRAPPTVNLGAKPDRVGGFEVLPMLNNRNQEFRLNSGSRVRGRRHTVRFTRYCTSTAVICCE